MVIGGIGSDIMSADTKQTQSGSKYDRLIAATKAVPSVPTIVVHPCDETSLRGALDSASAGIIQPVLVGPSKKIRDTAANFGLDISGFEIVDAAHSDESAAKGVELIHAAKGEMLMGGDPVGGRDGHVENSVHDRGCGALQDGRPRADHGSLLDGPLAFDNAIDVEAARIKGIKSDVAGRAQILVVPDLESGNMLAKNLAYLANADSAGIVLGARVPVVLTSRADSPRARMASSAVAALYSHARR
jgi:phosphotransacetylase